MDKQNNVFTDFCLEVQTISEVAEKMFSLCDENGVLYIPEFDDTDEGELTFQKLKLKWNKEDVKNVIKECEKIESEIKEIFYAFGGTDVLKMEKEEIASFLSADTVSVWEKYLKPNYKKVKDRKLYFVLFYAQKAYKEMRTSGALFFDEINHLLQAMIVQKYAKSVEKAEIDCKIKDLLNDKEYVIKAIESSITGGAGTVFRCFVQLPLSDTLHARPELSASEEHHPRIHIAGQGAQENPLPEVPHLHELRERGRVRSSGQHAFGS